MTRHGRELTEPYGSRADMVQRLMQENDVDLLIVVGVGLLGSYGTLQWLTGFRAGHRPVHALVPRVGSPRLVFGTKLRRTPPHETLFGNGVELLYADTLGEAIGSMPSTAGSSVRRLGYVSNASVPVRGMAEGVSAMVEGPVDLVDLTALLDDVKAVRTDAELTRLTDAVRLCEEGLDAIVKTVRPGMSHRAIARAGEIHAVNQGAEDAVTLVQCGAANGLRPSHRVIERGDLLSVIVELSLDGYWAEYGAVLSVGEPSDSACSMVRECLDVLAYTERLVKAGANCGGVAAAVGARIAELGASPMMALGHGVGIDEDAPLLSTGSKQTFGMGMAISLHPSLHFSDLDGGVTMTDTYRISSEGAVRLSSTAPTLRVVG